MEKQQDTTEIISKELNSLLTSTEDFLEEKFIKHIAGEPHSLFSEFNFKNWPKMMKNTHRSSKIMVSAISTKAAVIYRKRKCQ
ncbi:hypothetical protein DPMN_013577 [Dreissena polymorpha]|uniref:Uncharacterized protein n=1 Tax=Dreissena polymorpha TaxID=45954 RepID=A0A9D4N5P2_DREPO|nr:hypothetical protein DPMN_013577 [Dreissena polymorpha]